MGEHKEHDLSKIKVYEYEVEAEESDGHRWRPGFRYSFPYFSLAALILILGICGGIIAVVCTSDGEVVEDWDTHSASIFHHQESLSIAVNVWISGFVFFAGKLVALIFAEAVTIAWWVRAMKGRELRQLAHDFDASRSITAVLKTPKLFSWICLGSIAFTGFSGLGMILQQATTTEAVRQVKDNVAMTIEYATRMPYGFSGFTDNSNSSLPSYNHQMGKIIHDYQVKNPIVFPVHGCNGTDGSVCNTIFRGLGFNFDCSLSTGFLPPQDLYHENKTLWGVGFAWNHAPFTPLPDPAQSTMRPLSDQVDRIDLRAFWKNKTGNDGETLVVQSCVLTPAIVDYPILVTNNVTTLRPALNNVPHSTMLSDTLVRPLTNASAKQEFITGQETNSGYPTTWGGVARFFWELWASEIRYWCDRNDNYLYHLEGSSLFASTYQLKSKWHPAAGDIGIFPEHACYNTFGDPMEEIGNGIREIMFRVSVESAKGHLLDVFLESASHITLGPPPRRNHTDTSASFHRIKNVYRSMYLFLWLGLVLMMLALACIAPLFWQFWKLGRKVSLSPLELATAMHTSAAQEKADGNVFDTVKQKLAGNNLSNADTKELIEKMGDLKVKYGQVGPRTLGLAVDGTVQPPNQGAVYR